MGDGRSSGVVDQRFDAVVAELFAAIKESELDEERDGDDLGVESIEELDRSGGGASGGEEVIDQQDFFAGMDGVFVDFDDVFAIFERVGKPTGVPWQLALLADRDESGTEAVGHGGRENEAPGIDADDFVDLGATGGVAKQADRVLEEGSVGEDRGDVLEGDPRLREISDVTDGGSKVLSRRHGEALVSLRQRPNLKFNEF